MKTRKIKNPYIDIKGFEGKYQINKKGMVRSIDQSGSKQLEVFVTPLNNLYVILGKKNDFGEEVVYRAEIRNLIAIHFLPEPMEFDVLMHKDFNKMNVTAQNLEWMHLTEALLRIIQKIQDDFEFEISDTAISSLHLANDWNTLSEIALTNNLDFDQVLEIKRNPLWLELKWSYYEMPNPETGKIMGWRAIQNVGSPLREIKLDFGFEIDPLEIPVPYRAMHHAGSVFAYEEL